MGKPATQSLEELRAAHNPLFAIDQRYKQTVDDIRAAHAAGALSAAEMTSAIERAGAVAMASQRAFGRVQKQVEILGGQTKLTGDQIRNLGYQANDAATMLPNGASPFQVITTQAGQVVQALQDGPNGVRGSLTTMKESLVDAGASALEMAASLGPLKIAAIAAGAAVAGYAAVSWLKLEPLDKLIDAQAARIEGLREAYGIAGTAAEDYARRSGAALARQSEKAVQSDRSRLMDEAGGVLGRFSQFERRAAINPYFQSLAEAAERFRASVEAGRPSYIELDRALDAIAASNAPEATRKLAGEQADLIAPLVAVEKGITAETNAMDAASVAAARMGQAFGKALDTLKSLTPETRSQVEQINAAYAEAQRTAQSTQERMSAAAARDRALKPLQDEADAALREEQAKRAAVGLLEEAAAIADVTRHYAELIKTHQGDTVAVETYTKAQNEAIAAIREHRAIA